MEFEEWDNTCSVPVINRPIIYFLMDEEEVVYVGQSKIGLSRPFSHRDKQYTKLQVLECEEKDLDYLESKYIQKYKPKYNTHVGQFWFSFQRARNTVRKDTELKSFNLTDLRFLIKKMEINTEVFDNLLYLTNNDMRRIISFIQQNVEIMKNPNWKEKLF